MKKTIVLALAFATAVPVLVPLTAHAGPFSVSPDKERRVGQEAAADIEKNAPIVTGPVADWVERVGKRLAAVSNPEFKYDFHVIDSPEINAFCLPGGHVFVYTGMRKVVKTDDELAAVLGHEITHAEEHHYAKGSAKANGRGTLLAVGSILLGLPPALGQALSIGNDAMTQKYSRSNEYQADREGLARMERAGFDPNAMVTVLQRLSNEEDTDSLFQWMADHPEGKKRVAAIQALLPKVKASGGAVPAPAPGAPDGDAKQG